MINLARAEDCDLYILQELSEAGITAVPAEPHRREVPSSFEGRLGRITFTRAWYYWVADGPVPIAIAREMYNNSVGKKDVRAGGHCGCPPPDSQAEWIDPDGMPLISKKMIEEWREKYSEELFSIITRQEGESFRAVEDPSEKGILAVTTYHIDSQEGLNLFTQYIREIQ